MSASKSAGNVLAAIAFLHGLAAEELRQKELDYRDSHYEFSIMVTAVKPSEPYEIWQSSFGAGGFLLLYTRDQSSMASFWYLNHPYYGRSSNVTKNEQYAAGLCHHDFSQC